MWPLLLNFANWFVGTFLRAALIKFFFFTAIVLLVAALAALIFNYLANIDLFGLSNMVANLPDGLLYFLTVFQFNVGLPLMLGALVARFAIRRIPLIG